MTKKQENNIYLLFCTHFQVMEEEDRPFESAVQDTAVMDYSPSQPRNKNDRWTEGGLTGSSVNNKIDSKNKVIGKMAVLLK